MQANHFTEFFVFFSFLLVPFVEARFTAAFFSGGFSDGLSFFSKVFRLMLLSFVEKQQQQTWQQTLQ